MKCTRVQLPIRSCTKPFIPQTSHGLFAARIVMSLKRSSTIQTANSPGTVVLKRQKLNGSPGLLDNGTTINMDSQSPPRITLQPEEQLLCHVLLDCVNYISELKTASKFSSQEEGPSDATDSSENAHPTEPLVLRFAGGWVRDRLLDRQSHDIDIAINKMTGVEFGEHLYSFLSSADRATSYGLEPGAFHGLHKIKANPEKSKHLETATTRFLGLDLDFVNLRKEEYAHDSRTPTMSFGTEVEDTLRRDATINALFYNLHTQQVEDFTDRGLQDMKDEILRTPLDPYQTFEDDPLRVLRLIRFKSQLGFQIDPAALKTMQLPAIQQALKMKISRERVGVELEKALRSKRPEEALELISKLGLYNTIFSDPMDTEAEQIDIEGWVAAITVMKKLLSTHEAEDKEKTSVERLASHFSRWTANDRYLAWVLTALLPAAVQDPQDAKIRQSKTDIPKAIAISQRGIKAPNTTTSLVADALQHATDIRSFLQRADIQASEPDNSELRADLGLAIYDWGPLWRHLILFSMLELVIILAKTAGHSEADHQSSTPNLDPCAQAAALLEKIEHLDLTMAFEQKPILTGKKLAMRLDRKSGPWMKHGLRYLRRWQFAHPESAGADLEEAVQYVQDNMEAVLRLETEELIQATEAKAALQQRTKEEVARQKKAQAKARNG